MLYRDTLYIYIYIYIYLGIGGTNSNTGVGRRNGYGNKGSIAKEGEGRESLSIERNMAMTTDRTTQTGEPVVWVFNARETGVIV